MADRATVLGICETLRVPAAVRTPAFLAGLELIGDEGAIREFIAPFLAWRRAQLAADARIARTIGRLRIRNGHAPWTTERASC